MRFIRFRYAAIAFLAFSTAIICSPHTFAADSQWEDIFNGKDLTGWETWLRAPEDQGGQKGKPLGINNDPAGIFTIKDGVLRVSGEIFGCISSLESYQDYQLRFDFKWGEKKWPPRVNALRDSGFLYHCYGPHGAFWNCWKACVEYQVQEGDVGDLIFLSGPGGKTLLAKGKDGKQVRVYNPLGDLVKAPRTRHSGRYEYPNGEWNTCQVICRDDDAVHIVNGFVVNRVYDIVTKRDGQVVPLKAGQLQFQSEAAEIFYQRIQKRDLGNWQDGASAAEKMLPTDKEIVANDSTTSVSYTNTGDVAVHIPAIEVLGAAAGDFQFDLPDMPAVVEPGGEFRVGVRSNGKKRKESTATLRLEGVGGPIESSQVALVSKASK